MQTQENYEARVRRYFDLLHDADQYSLITKYHLFSSLLSEYQERGGALWKIEPLLHMIIQSVEADMHIGFVNLFDDDGHGLHKFLRFCKTNLTSIVWKESELTVEVLIDQEERLDQHEQTIEMLRKRRNKYFAHADKKYVRDKNKMYSDFPLTNEDFESLIETVSTITREHWMGISPKTIPFSTAGVVKAFTSIMVQNLETGRKANYPHQILDSDG